MHFAVHMAAICTCIVLFVFLAVGTVLFTIRRSTTEEEINSVVSEINLADIRVGVMMNDDDADLSLAEYIHDHVNPELLSRYNLSEGNIEELLEEEDIKTFLSEKLWEYCDYIYSGGSEPKVTAREIVKLLEKNESAIYRITGYQLAESDYQSIEDSLNETTIGALDLSNVSEDYEGTFSLLRAVLSYWLIALIAALVLMLCVLIFVLYRKYIAHAFLAAGITFALMGLLCLMISVISGNMVDVLYDAFYFPKEAVRPIISHIASNMAQTGTVILVLGLILVFVRIGVGVMRKKVNHQEG